MLACCIDFVEDELTDFVNFVIVVVQDFLFHFIKFLVKLIHLVRQFNLFFDLLHDLSYKYELVRVWKDLFEAIHSILHQTHLVDLFIVAGLHS